MKNEHCLFWVAATALAALAVIICDPSLASADQEGNDYPSESRFEVSVTEDFSFPQAGEYDYGLDQSDITINSAHPVVGQPLAICANVHNHGLCLVSAAWGWYSSSGRSCWCEWDFTRTVEDLADISFRCRDDDAAVHWRVELDGVHLASPVVPSTSGGENFMIVTIHDVPVTAGAHTLFLGTYQMDFYPDYRLDWVQLGDQRIEAETYQRMGGNDPNSDYRGVSIYPRAADPPPARCLTAQIWLGDPSAGGTLLAEDFLGPTTMVCDFEHAFSGNRYQAHYLADHQSDTVKGGWIPGTAGDYEIHVVVDPLGRLTEFDEQNNTTVVQLTVFEPGTISAQLTCSPSAGTLPFTSQICLDLMNNENGYRSAAVRMDLHLAGGQHIETWRQGVTHFGPLELEQICFNQYLPPQQRLVGINRIELMAEDVTPPPYNQPPFPPAGDTATGECEIRGNAP